jgi:hypothetical protein
MKTLAALLLLALLSLPTLADTSVWNATDGSWDVDGNWDPATGYPNSLSTDVIFPDQGQDCVITLPNNRSTRSLMFDSPYSYTIVGTNGGVKQLRVEADSPSVTIGVSNGSHRLIGTFTSAGNGGGVFDVASGCVFTVEGDLAFAQQSGRGFRDKYGGGEFIVTGMSYSSDWGSPNVHEGTLACLGGWMYRNSYRAQENKTFKVSTDAKLVAGGSFDSQDILTNTPSLNLDGTLDVYGTLNWNDGSFNLADAQAIEFELGSSPDKIMYNVDKSPSPVLTGPSPGPCTIRLTEGPGINVGTYDLIDWSAALNLTVTDLSLDDFVIEKPSTWSVQLKFDNGVQTADVNTTKLQVDVVPEPAAAMAAACALLLLRKR